MSIKSREERQRAAVIGYCKNCGRSSETHGVVCEIAEPVEIVDQPEAYAKMREAAGLCSDCGGDRHAHMSNCPRLAAAVALMPLPQPTAYDRDQQALRDRVTTIENRIDGDAVAAIVPRLDAALRRIEQLELEVARHRVWLRLPADVCMHCGTAFTTPQHAQNHTCNRGHVSPATAYPPMPDEGT